MIRILIENIPDNREIEAEVLGYIHITEEDKPSEMFSNYQYIIDDNIDNSGRVDSHFRSNNIWKLVYKILQQEFGDGS